jgi:holo-[acyl-carrier protein] synthase
MYIGVDIVEVDRISRLIKYKKSLNDIFTINEIENSKNSNSVSQSYSKKISGKEAFSKALGTGFTEYSMWKEIEIIENEDSVEVNVYGRVKHLVSEKGIKKFFISLSSCDSLANAYVVLL